MSDVEDIADLRANVQEHGKALHRIGGEVREAKALSKANMTQFNEFKGAAALLQQTAINMQQTLAQHQSMSHDDLKQMRSRVNEIGDDVKELSVSHERDQNKAVRQALTIGATVAMLAMGTLWTLFSNGWIK